MTKILLEVIFVKAINEVFLNKQLQITSLLREYENTYRMTYLTPENLAEQVKLGSQT